MACSFRMAVLLAAGLALVACAAGDPRPKSHGEPGHRLLLDPDAAEWMEPAPDSALIEVSTSRGAFRIRVRRAWAPEGVDRFYNLVRHGYYDDSRFSRVVSGFIVQWGIAGDPAVNRAWAGHTIADDPVRASNTRGRIAFAMTGPDTRHTQVYISLADNARLDAQGFAPLGEVVDGMEVVDLLHAGYGEESGGGMRRGQQGPLLEGGNAYVDARFPDLDRLITARVVSSG